MVLTSSVSDGTFAFLTDNQEVNFVVMYNFAKSENYSIKEEKSTATFKRSVDILTRSRHGAFLGAFNQLQPSETGLNKVG